MLNAVLLVNIFFIFIRNTNTVVSDGNSMYGDIWLPKTGIQYPFNDV